MCGRFTLIKPEEIMEIFHIEGYPLKLEASYNIAPSQQVPIIFFDEETSKASCELMTWGLVPPWSKEPKTKYSTINARIETITSKPSFKKLVGQHNCIIPTNGYYEWQQTSDGKEPMFIGFKDAPLFGLAGLWDEWQSHETGQILRTFTIITLPSSGPVASIHTRMPGIIMPDQTLDWITPHPWTDKQVETLLEHQPYDKLHPYQVSKLVNSPRNNDPSLVERVV